MASKKTNPVTLNAKQLTTCEAVEILTAQLKHAPSEQEVGTHLGLSKSGARRAMLACVARGAMTAPVQTTVGEWAVLPAGKAALKKRLTE